MKRGPFLAPVEKLTWNDDLGFWCLSLSLCFWVCLRVGWLVGCVLGVQVCAFGFFFGVVGVPVDCQSA